MTITGKRNIEKFDDDFMFQLTKEEADNLMSQNVISSWGGTRYLPYAFSEQGVYMLMTVLKGDLPKIFKSFTKTDTEKEFLILNGQITEADVAYQGIYAKAKRYTIVVLPQRTRGKEQLQLRK